jgi:hypothetical protein
VSGEQRLADLEHGPALADERTRALEQVMAVPARDGVTEVVADDRGSDRDGDHQRNRELSGGGQRAGGDQRGFSRHRHAPRLGHDEHEEKGVTGGLAEGKQRGEHGTHHAKAGLPAAHQPTGRT